MIATSTMYGRIRTFLVTSTFCLLLSSGPSVQILENLILNIATGVPDQMMIVFDRLVAGAIVVLINISASRLRMRLNDAFITTGAGALTQNDLSDKGAL